VLAPYRGGQASCPGQSAWDLLRTSDTETVFSLSYSVFPCQYHSTAALHIHISSEGWVKSPLEAQINRDKASPHENNKYRGVHDDNKFLCYV
jgi:hypothetical protein